MNMVSNEIIWTITIDHRKSGIALQTSFAWQFVARKQTENRNIRWSGLIPFQNISELPASQSWALQFVLSPVSSRHLLTGTSVQPPAKGSMVTRTVTAHGEKNGLLYVSVHDSSVSICCSMIAVPAIPSAPGLSWAFAPALPPGPQDGTWWNKRSMEPDKAWFRVLVLYQQSGQSLSLSSPSAPGGISSTWSVASMADLGQRWTVRN